VLAHRLAAPAVAQAPFDELLAILRQDGSAAQVAAMDAFARRDDAAAAIAPLLARMRAEAPSLDNDGCLALERILRAHADADLPRTAVVEALLEVLARPIWTSRQKAAQALAEALRPEVVAGREEVLARALVPLLTSQRSRVYRAGDRCLAAVAGRSFDGDPIAARAWFHRRFGKGLDLLAGIHEVVVCVRAAGTGFVVQERPIADLTALTAAIHAERLAAARQGLEVGVVFSTTAAAVDAVSTPGGAEEVHRVLAAIGAGGVTSTTIAPASDVFRAPFVDTEDGAVAALRAQLQATLDRLRGDRIPGAQASVVLPDGRLIALASGVRDRETASPMPVDGRLLAGSTGKTFFAALALQLVREGRLDLDARVATFLGDEPWFARVPNASDLTVRLLMQHRSGVMRYETTPAFLAALRARPDHRFTPAEEVAFVLDRKPRFAAGAGFDYSDTNYVLLGMVLERATGEPCFDAITRRFLRPLGLRGTVPARGREIPGLLQSYAGPNDPFSGRDAMLVDGRLPFDPGFEGAGGGFATTAADLARWAVALYDGDVLAGVRDTALAALPAPLGKDTGYGLGVIVNATALGPAWGHDGWFPGSMSTMRWFPTAKVAVAVTVNASTDPRLARDLLEWAVAFARLAAGR
jgi:D-alanyl-D-alanine carboxypeptidase